MIAFITTIHIMAAMVMILVVLLQSGSSADLAGAFGGGGSQTAFGPRGAQTLLSKLTTVSAILFMCTSFTLAIMASKRSVNSVLEGGSRPVPQQSIPLTAPSGPATPAPTPATAPPTTPSGAQTVPVTGATGAPGSPKMSVEVKTTPVQTKGAAPGATKGKAPETGKKESPEKK